MIAVEDRLTVIETKIKELQKRVLEERQSLHREMETLLQQRLSQQSNWIPKVAGSMKDFPEFDEVVQLGREARQDDRTVEKPEK